MLQSAHEGGYAYPSINVTSSSSVNAAIAAFAEAKSDGIVQVSTGGGEFASGPAKNMAVGATALADHAHLISKDLPVLIALTTDHCVPDKVDTFVRPLIAETAKRRKAGLPNLFSGHMFDGSELPMGDNLRIGKQLLAECAAQELILEVEIGVVGGEEDGLDNTGAAKHKLYTTPEDMLLAFETLNEAGPFTLAAAFGNVHGVYKPGSVQLRPDVLREGNDLVVSRHGKAARMQLVFHGGSGSDLSDIHAAIDYGVVKMNVDTDCQYAYTRPAAEHMMRHFDGVLKIDGELGEKKMYDPRTWVKKSEAGMKARVMQACDELRSTGRTLYGKI